MTAAVMLLGIAGMAFWLVPQPPLEKRYAAVAAAVFIEISIAVAGSALVGLGTEGVKDLPDGFGTPAAVGKLLLEDFLIAFEAASILLLLAAVAAIVLAGRRHSPTEEGT